MEDNDFTFSSGINNNNNVCCLSENDHDRSVTRKTRVNKEVKLLPQNKEPRQCTCSKAAPRYEVLKVRKLGHFNPAALGRI